jgi:hypothetical protein
MTEEEINTFIRRLDKIFNKVTDQDRLQSLLTFPSLICLAAFQWSLPIKTEIVFFVQLEKLLIYAALFKHTGKR